MALAAPEDTYLSSRAEALHNVESTIHELGGIFQQLAVMVSCLATGRAAEFTLIGWSTLTRYRKIDWGLRSSLHSVYTEAHTSCLCRPIFQDTCVWHTSTKLIVCVDPSNRVP